jgi:transcriptional regulator with XRE-family HTH domain
VNALSNLRDKLAHSKRYRESFAASVVKRMIPLQIRVLRKHRSWSQAQLAHESRLTQGVISRAEDPEYGNLSMNTLVRIAAGFDCAFVGRFVPFSELAKWYTGLTNENTLQVAGFGGDVGFLERKEPILQVGYVQDTLIDDSVFVRQQKSHRMIMPHSTIGTGTQPVISLQSSASFPTVEADAACVWYTQPQVAASGV